MTINSMIHRKLVLGFSMVVVVVVLITSTNLPSGARALNAQSEEGSGEDAYESGNTDEDDEE
jgi:NADH:ubiquinone oxidoreductase subunit 3 (subunit A)